MEYKEWVELSEKKWKERIERMSILVGLPWMPKELSPNTRVGYRKKAEIYSQAKNDAYILARAHLEDAEKHDYWEAKYLFHPPDKRKRDLDNMISSCKAYLDGLCAAYDIDDEQIKRMVGVLRPSFKPGKVLIRLAEYDFDDEYLID